MIVPSWAAHCSWWIMLKNVATLVGPKITALLTALLNITEQLAQLVLWLDIHSKPVLCQLQYYINNLKMFLHQIKISIDSTHPHNFFFFYTFCLCFISFLYVQCGKWFFNCAHANSISCHNVTYPFPFFAHSVSDLWREQSSVR